MEEMLEKYFIKLLIDVNNYTAKVSYYIIFLNFRFPHRYQTSVFLEKQSKQVGILL